MWEIVGFQYLVSEIVLTYISESILPYFAELIPEYSKLMPEHFRIFEIDGILFITTFILSLFAFFLWRLISKITGFRAYRPEKYRLVLFLNVFYLVPFAYGLIWGRFNIINVFLLFLWSGAYHAFQYIISHPDMVIDYFAQNGILL